MPDYDPDREYFRQLGQRTEGPLGTRVVLTGSVPAWQCSCFHLNHEVVERCNNCGRYKPGSFPTEHLPLRSLSEAAEEYVPVPELEEAERLVAIERRKVA